VRSSPAPTDVILSEPPATEEFHPQASVTVQTPPLKLKSKSDDHPQITQMNADFESSNSKWAFSTACFQICEICGQTVRMPALR
jgi:hypothetical protein